MYNYVHNTLRWRRMAKRTLANLLECLPGQDVEETDEVTVMERRGFTIPEGDLTVVELVDQAGPEYLRACLDMAQRAMVGDVNPLKEGDLPHKMALMLAHKMIPYRKFRDKAPDKTPAETKRAARALQQIIDNLSEEGEIISEKKNIEGREIAVVGADGTHNWVEEDEKKVA